MRFGTKILRISPHDESAVSSLDSHLDQKPPCRRNEPSSAGVFSHLAFRIAASGLTYVLLTMPMAGFQQTVVRGKLPGASYSSERQSRQSRAPALWKKLPNVSNYLTKNRGNRALAPCNATTTSRRRHALIRPRSIKMIKRHFRASDFPRESATPSESARKTRVNRQNSDKVLRESLSQQPPSPHRQRWLAPSTLSRG